MDRERFCDFVLGFPRRYLANTPRVEIVKHYLLVESLGDKPVISSLAKEGNLWKLCLVASDRKFLFLRFAGTLSCFGMNIVTAEAFANANSLVLDTFHFVDPERYFAKGNHKQQFQYFLEEVVQGKTDLEPLLKIRWDRLTLAENETFSADFDNDSHPSATCLTLNSPDHFGHLYLVSRCISEEGHNIEMAYVETSGGRVNDQFYLTHDGAKLTRSRQETLKSKLARLGERLSHHQLAELHF